MNNSKMMKSVVKGVSAGAVKSIQITTNIQNIRTKTEDKKK
jgi:hypothetical protein